MALDIQKTLISQYANSPTIVQLVTALGIYFDQTMNFKAFYDYLWNVDTAQGFGLDIWGRIVGVSRQLNAPGVLPVFGFMTSSPTDFTPFNNAPMSNGGAATAVYTLPDEAYRRLVLTKAFANICDCSIPMLNQLLSTLMAGRGKSYVVDNGGMALTYTFDFSLTALDYAILTQSGVVPHPTGVLVNISSATTELGSGDAFDWGSADAALDDALFSMST